MNSSAGSTQQQQRKASNQNIQVYARVRPINTRERLMRSAEVIEVTSPREVVTRHTADSKLTKKFTFDRVFGPESRQCDVYNTVVAPLIDEVLAGYNCTVFAYGQTGTGKTHTMVGTECAELKSSWEDDSDIGIIPRALCHLFDELRMLELEFSMRISYLELYNEELCDLLSSDDSTKIRIFDDSTKKGSVIIQGLEEIPVHSKDDVYKLLEKGKERRKTAMTLMNAQSSRSHTVFSILVHIRENGIDGDEMLKTGKLNLVDLAGSENVTKSGNEKGIRVRETVNINQSLLTLGRVITALVERTPHIPYRESKLTRLLQESLGGRTKTSIIATISPGHKDIEETLSTLEYAHRAKNIQNKPEVNQKLTKKTILKEYTEEIDKLKRDLMAARDKNGIYLAEETYNELTVKMDSQHRELNEKMLLLKALKDELQNKEKIFNEVSLNLVEKTEELKRIEQNLLQTTGTLMQTKQVLKKTKRRYKEKKVLLESHAKTEEKLINQATEILNVADIATHDTLQLHSTIERRNDVDRKIQSTFERFVERMYENFEMVDENFDKLNTQHKTHAQLLMEELNKNSTAQIELLSDASPKILKMHQLCEQSLEATTAVSDKFTQTLNKASDEHRAEIMKLVDVLKNNANTLKTQLQANLGDLATSNIEQKAAMHAMRNNFSEILQRNTSALQTHTKEMQAQLTSIAMNAESSMKELEQLQTAIGNERSLAAQEQAVLDECLAKMQALKQKRAENSTNMSAHTAQLTKHKQETIEQLQKNVACAQAYCEQTSVSNVNAQQQLEHQVDNALAYSLHNAETGSAVEMQLEQLCAANAHQMDAIAAQVAAHSTEVHSHNVEHGSEVKRIRLENTKLLQEGSSDVQTTLKEHVKRLKGHNVLAIEFANKLQYNVHDYGQTYAVQMKNCTKDLEKFRESDLQMYKSTGSTPSKRDFVYPRVLATTSPHNQIVKRFRQENDWSDLDTTATIDEGSENEDEADEERQSSLQEDISGQNISETETILNSTPIDTTPEAPQKRSSSTNGKKMQTLKQSQRNAQTRQKTPSKNSAHNSLTDQKSPVTNCTKENKENFTVTPTIIID